MINPIFVKVHRSPETIKAKCWYDALNGDLTALLSRKCIYPQRKLDRAYEEILTLEKKDSFLKSHYRKLNSFLNKRLEIVEMKAYLLRFTTNYNEAIKGILANKTLSRKVHIGKINSAEDALNVANQLSNFINAKERDLEMQLAREIDSQNETKKYKANFNKDWADYQKAYGVAINPNITLASFNAIKESVKESIKQQKQELGKRAKHTA